MRIDFSFFIQFGDRSSICLSFSSSAAIHLLPSWANRLVGAIWLWRLLDCGQSVFGRGASHKRWPTGDLRSIAGPGRDYGLRRTGMRPDTI